MWLSQHWWCKCPVSGRFSVHDVHAGMNQISEKQMNEAEKQFKAFESMINSMTPQERSNPDLLAKVSSAV